MYARLEEWKPLFASGGQAAFVVRKGGADLRRKAGLPQRYTLRREEVIRRISAAAGDDPIVCTTGKASRELFEIREARGEGHGHDFRPSVPWGTAPPSRWSLLCGCRSAASGA